MKHSRQNKALKKISGRFKRRKILPTIFLFVTINFCKNKAWKIVWQRFMKDKVSSQMFHLLWKMISKINKEEHISNIHEKKKIGHNCFISNCFYQNKTWMNIICQFIKKKKLPTNLFFSNEKLSTKKSGRIYYFGSWRKKYTDCYKTKIWLKNVLTLVYTSGVAQTKNGQNFKSWSCQTNTVEYWAASNNLNS